MAEPFYIPGDLVVAGSLRAGAMATPADSIGDAEMDPADPILTDKQYHRIYKTYQTDRGSAVTAKRQVCHIAKAAGTIVSLKTTCGVACTGTTSYVKTDIRKNGSVITSTAAENNPLDAAYGSGDEGVFSALTYVAGDKLEFDVTVSAGDGAVGQELCSQLILDEQPG